VSAPLVIGPSTRVGALLAAYPALEPVLIGFAPEFARLKNPVLRRTVAKVATLAQAARIARVDVRELVLALRRAVGPSSGPGDGVPVDPAEVAAGDDGEAPAWTRDRRAAPPIDADQILAAGSHPLASVERQARALAADQMLSLRSSFVPAPLIDVLRAQGFHIHTRSLGPEAYETLIARPDPTGGDPCPTPSTN
jgi:hypothetical protein